MEIFCIIIREPSAFVRAIFPGTNLGIYLGEMEKDLCMG